MPRVKRGVRAHARHKKVMKMAKGYRGGRRRLYRSAREAVDRALCFAYRDRKVRKREFRNLWIIRINAAVRPFGYPTAGSSINWPGPTSGWTARSWPIWRFINRRISPAW